MKNITLFLANIFLAAFIFGCNNKPENFISADAKKIADGETVFNTYCSGCHNFKQNGIGPSS